MINQLIILRGLPGSGKSSLAAKLSQKYYHKKHIVRTFSADSFFYEDSEYKFDRTKLGEAHKFCHDELVKFLKQDRVKPLIAIIDNTNVKLKDFRQYLDTANQFGLLIRFIEPNTEWKFDPITLAEKNTHGVSVETIERMKNKWQTLEDIARNNPSLMAWMFRHNNSLLE